MKIISRASLKINNSFIFCNQDVRNTNIIKRIQIKYVLKFYIKKFKNHNKKLKSVGGSPSYT